jgi:integrase
MAIYKRDGHWWFSKTINGNRTRKPLPTARTKAQAEEAERKELERLHNARYGIEESSSSFIEYAEKVFLPWAKENKLSKDDPYLLGPIKAFFGKLTFEEISPLLIEKYKSQRKNGLTRYKRKRAAASVNRELACISRIFSLAIRDCVTSINPCLQVRKLRENNQRTRYLTEAEEIELLKQCTGEREHLRPIILMAIHTGMRRGEILSLRWSQIDFARGFIHLINTKSGKSRDVPINRIAREILLWLQRKSSSEFLFPNPRTGKPIKEIKHAFTKSCVKAKITGFRFHDLRHTAATRLADGAADAFTIAAILGHSDLRMTARYTHAMDSRKREAVERLADFGNSGHDLVTIKKREG